jgi:hypothetical protein
MFGRGQRIGAGPQVGVFGARCSTHGGGAWAVLALALCAARGAPVVDGAVQALDVPLEQRLRIVDGRTQRAAEDVLEFDRAGGQRQPAQVADAAVDDGVGAGVEELRIDIAHALLQLEQALGMAQGHVQHHVGDPAGLFFDGQIFERFAIEERAAIGVERGAGRGGQLAIAFSHIAVRHPQCQAASGRCVLHQALHRGRAACAVAVVRRHGVRALRGPQRRALRSAVWRW